MHYSSFAFVNDAANQQCMSLSQILQAILILDSWRYASAPIVNDAMAAAEKKEDEDQCASVVETGSSHA